MHMFLLIKKIFQPKNRKGQTTLLMVLMVMVVSLGVGLAVSQRTATNIRKTTNVKQTEQAFGCAQTGIDKALLCIKDKETAGGDPKADCSATDTPLIENSKTVCTYTYTVGDYLPDSAGSLEFKNLPKDAVQQLITNNVSSINVKWKPLKEGDSTGLEVTYAYKDGSDYKMEKFFNWCGNSPSNFTGFTPLTPDGEGYCNTDLSFPSPVSNESLVRIRTYGGDVNLIVSSSDADFSGIVQGYLIKSTGSAGTVKRTIQVARMNPQLPAIFDYVLYSEEGSITK